MAQITTHATLKTAVADYLARGDLTAYIPYFVQGAEARLNKLRLRHMETALSATVALGVIAVPSGYLEMKNLQVVSSGRKYPLQRRTLEQMYEDYPVRSSTGLPRCWAREGSNIIFGPYPDSDYSITGTYYAKPTALSADGDTNWWILNNPLAMLYACLLEAEPFLKKDQRLQVWSQLLQNAINDIKAEEIEESISGGGMVETLG
jgi:hypothetical protein